MKEKHKLIVNETTSFSELFRMQKSIGFMMANMNIMDEPLVPDCPKWAEYNKYRTMLDRIDDIIYGKTQSLEVQCPAEWIGISA